MNNKISSTNLDLNLPNFSIFWLELLDWGFLTKNKPDTQIRIQHANFDHWLF